MDCNIIKDLIPLYIDACCSDESALTVKKHLTHCASCRELCKSMNALCETPQTPAVPVLMSRLNTWKASILQSILLFLSFAAITAGVALEARTPVGPLNGLWAVALIIPAAGFMLSLANWYFVSLYRNRKLFSRCSLLCTLGCTFCAYLWAVFHYIPDFTTDALSAAFIPCVIGLLLTTLFCILSKTLSNLYAQMIGKD